MAGSRGCAVVVAALAFVGALLCTQSAAGQATPSRTPINGFADTHVHQFSYLGFGGLIVWGAAYSHDGDIATALPWSHWTPSNLGAFLPGVGFLSSEVVGPDGSPVLTTGCPQQSPNPVFNLPKCPPSSPVLQGTCPPGSGTSIFNQCLGILVHGGGGVYDGINLALSGSIGHAVGGYPEFDGWPRWNVYTGQQVYYEWLHRAFRGGLKLMVMLAVNNEVLCGLGNRIASFGCADMPATDRQIQAAKDLEAFVDAQSGGPGRGWYRIAYSAEQARQIINSGKLAVVLGIEVPGVFGCKKQTATTTCTDEAVRAELQRYYDMGVRHIFPVHIADNAFAGTALYSAVFGFNNRIITGDWWDVVNCDVNANANPNDDIDFHLTMFDRLNGDRGFFDILGHLAAFGVSATVGTPPRPPAGSNCNERGLQERGRTLIDAMMDKGMMIDVDHTSARTLEAILDRANERRYPGLVMGHTGMIEMGQPKPEGDDDFEYKRHEGNKTEAQIRKLRAVGGLAGVILHQGKRKEVKVYRRPDGTAPVDFSCGNSSESWAQVYLYTQEKMRPSAVNPFADRWPEDPVAVAVGSDFNGLAGMPAPRWGRNSGEVYGGGDACGGDRPDAVVTLPGAPPRPRVSYPFTTFCGSPIQMDKQQVGNKTFDINYDGLANIGMYPDFIEELRQIGVSDQELAPLCNSAEAYIRAWERAEDHTGPALRCDSPDGAWHATDVSIACTAGDVVSLLEHPEDAAFSLGTTVAPGTETANASTGTRTVCDRRLNCATAGPVAGNKVDKKAPTVVIIQPTATDYVHSASLTLDYSATDGGSGLASVSALLDGSATVAGHGVASGQLINLLTELPLGEHTLDVRAADYVGNTGSASVTFRIVVTPESVKAAVRQLELSGAIRTSGLAQSLLSKLDRAAEARSAGNCTLAASIYEAAMSELQAQTGNGVTATAAQILIGDIEYLIAHCP